MMTRIGKAISPKRTGYFLLLLAGFLSLGENSAIAKPDLTVLELKQLPPNAPVNTGTISVKISNLGDSTTLFINLDIAFYIDGYLCDSIGIIGGLGGDKSKVKTTTKCNPATPGPHTIQVAVDYTNEVKESNETNNIVSQVFLWYDDEICDAEELCNGVDDTCDGEVDESFFELGQPCDGGDDDSCKQGTFVCNNEGTGVTCDEPSGIQTELCNGVDDDCDGTTDEGFDPIGEPCVQQVDGCTIEGIWTCAENELASICEGVPIDTGVELCNALDDDCDGSTDEAYPFVGTPCVLGTGACRNVGEHNCSGGEPNCGALEGFPPSPADSCGNREDDNCNGVFDEGCDCVPGSYVPCGSSVGACRLGILECGANNTLSGACIGAVTPQDEICGNEIDDDCDGSIDEGCTCVSGFVRPCTPGTGVCSTGAQTCITGAWGMCKHDQTPTVELCDIVDNDCDGFRDEGCPCFPGELVLCEVQKDACAEYYAVCTETFKWSPCLPKPGSEDPTCGEEPDAGTAEDATTEADITVQSENDESSAQNNEQESDVLLGYEPETEEDSSPKKVVIIQQEPEGCSTNASTGNALLVMCLLILVGIRRRGSLHG